MDGISTLGVKLYGAESADGKKVTESSSYELYGRINSIGEVSVDPASIDASALEDYVTKRIAGRSDVSETLTIGVNLTDETLTAWEAIKGKKVCWMIDIPSLTKAVFVVGEVPSTLPLPGLDQNALLVMSVNLIVNDFIGFDTKITVGQ